MGRGSPGDPAVLLPPRRILEPTGHDMGTSSSAGPMPPQLESRLSSLRARARLDARKTIATGAIVSVALAALAFAVLERRKARLDEDALEAVAQPATSNLAQRLRANLEVLRGTAAFVSATGEALTEARFRDYTRPHLDRHPAVYALEWAPRITSEDRPRFEARERELGRVGFEISDPDGTSRLRSAPERPVHYPIRFEEPRGSGVGLDLAFESRRRADVEAALATRDIIVSAPFDLAERDGPAVYVATYLSVDEPSGVAVLVLETTTLFETWRDQTVDPGVGVWVEGRPTEYGQLRLGTAPSGQAELVREEAVRFGAGDIRVGFAAPAGLGGGGPMVWTGTGMVFVLGLLGTGIAWGIGRVRSLRAQVDKAKELGQYVVERKLGQGAMGVVFLARHALMKRPTALKLMLSQDPKSIDRFEREVRLSCQLSHPNIIALYDFGRTEDGLFYYAMEYLPGIDLHTLVLQGGPIGDGRAVRFLSQLAMGLREAHAAGLVHRDIKPGNLVATRIGTQVDLLKILDFGLVKPVDDRNAPDAGRVVGTPLYMAPEAIRTPDEVGPASDVYATGCVAFHLLAGHPPFMGGNVSAILRMHLDDEPPSLSSKSFHTISPELDRLVTACLDKDPAARPTDDELVDRLSRLVVEQPWTDWEAAQWWSQREISVAEPGGETPSIHEVTVLANRRPLE